MSLSLNYLEQLNNEIWNFEVTESKYSVTSPFQPHPQGLRSTEDRQKSDVSIGSIDTKKIGAVMIEDLKRANYINIGVVSKPNDALSAEELCQTDTDELQLSLPDSKVNRLNDSKMKINQTDILKVLLGDSIVRDVEFYVPEKDVKNDLKAFLKNSESNGSCIACDEVKMTCSLESINPDIEQHNETSLYIVVDDLLSLVHKKFISHQLETNCDKSLSDTFSSFLHECAMVLPLRHQEPCEWSSVEKAFSSELSPSLRSFNVSCALEESVLLQHDFKEVMNIREQSHPLLNIYPNTEKATLATGSIDSNFEMINRHSPRSEEPFFSVSCDCLNDFLPLPLTPKLENMESSMEHLKTLWPQWQKYVRGMKYQIWLTEYIKEMFECSVKCFKNKKSRSSRRS